VEHRHQLVDIAGDTSVAEATHDLFRFTPRRGEARTRIAQPAARTREDLPRLVALYRSGKLKIDELITKRYGLDEANEAFRALAAGELGRGLIVF
jgi:Zn-dependent alcohol dehydrogenase